MKIIKKVALILLNIGVISIFIGLILGGILKGQVGLYFSLGGLFLVVISMIFGYLYNPRKEGGDNCA